jgi:hypothetical protein
MYVGWTKTLNMVLSLLDFCLYPVSVVKVPHLKIDNFVVFIEIGIFVDRFGRSRPRVV